MRNPQTVLSGIALALLLAVRLHAGEVPVAPSWPEIKDPGAIIKVAREIIVREIGKKPQLSDRFMEGVEETRFGFSEPTQVSVGRTQVLIAFGDIPYTGRALLIIPEAAPLPSIAGVRIENTATPEIKRVWLNLLATEATQHCGSVELRDFKNLDAESASAPQARVTPWPAYPPDYLRAGIMGKVDARLTVKPDGTTADIETKGDNDEFKQAVRDALRGWRFIPGVDQARRVPVATRIAVTVVFTINGE